MRTKRTRLDRAIARAARYERAAQAASRAAAEEAARGYGARGYGARGAAKVNASEREAAHRREVYHWRKRLTRATRVISVLQGTGDLLRGDQKVLPFFID